MTESGKIKLVKICDNMSLFALCAIAYLLPISKALLTSFSGLAVLGFLIKKITLRQGIPLLNGNATVIAYFIVCFSSIFTSLNQGISVTKFFGKTLLDVLLFFTIVEVLTTEKRLKPVLCLLLISSLVLGIDGIYQVFSNKDFLRQRSYAYPGRIRINACFPTANDFGAYLTAVIPYTFIFIFDKARQIKTKVTAGSLFILLFICLILTVSRGAWFAFIASLVFVSLWIPLVGVLFLVLFLLVFIGKPFYDLILKERVSNFFSFIDFSSSDRLIMWQTAWNMFLSRPWIGVGLFTFMANFEKFCPVKYEYGIPYAHNCYLQIMAEIGIIGLVAFLSILCFYFLKGIRVLNRGKRNFSWYVLLASLSSMLGYCVQMVVDTSFFSLDLGKLFWLILGIGFAAMNLVEKTPEKCGV